MTTYYLRDGRQIPSHAHMECVNKNGKSGKVRVTEKCGRCGGAGGWRGWPGYTCYECHGDGKRDHVYRCYTQERLDELNAMKERRDVKKRIEDARKEEARREQINKSLSLFEKAYPNIIRGLNAYSTKDSFLSDLKRNLQTYGSLTDAQITAAGRCIAARDAEAKRLETAQVVPTDRIEIKGKVISIKIVNGFYGAQIKALIEDNRGFRLYGTLPKAISEAERGDLVSFTATTKPSDDDKHFGFYSRPVKAHIHEE